MIILWRDGLLLVTSSITWNKPWTGSDPTLLCAKMIEILDVLLVAWAVVISGRPRQKIIKVATKKSLIARFHSALLVGQAVTVLEWRSDLSGSNRRIYLNINIFCHIASNTRKAGSRTLRSIFRPDTIEYKSRTRVKTSTVGEDIVRATTREPRSRPVTLLWIVFVVWLISVSPSATLW